MPVIPKITDAFVTIDVTHPQPTVGLKNSNVFVKGDKESYKEYTYLDAVEADWNADTSVYKIAEQQFAQNPAPELVAVTTFTGNSAVTTAQAPAPSGVTADATNDGATVKAEPVTINEPGDDVPTQGIAKAAFDYFYNNWEFALLADYNKDDALALSNLIEHGGYDAKGYHILFLQFNADNKDDATEFASNTRTWCFYHTDTDELYAAALAAAGAQPTIGQVSWKFVSDLANVTPETLPASDIMVLEKKGLICYFTKGNHSNQTDDMNAAGFYIDEVHGRDQVKATIETNLQNTLNTAGKTPFDAIGLGMIAASLESSLSLSYNAGIIATDPDTGKPMYTTHVPSIKEVGRFAIASRVLKNTTFGYTPSSAINKVYVRGNEQMWA
ncbi:DUF3383 domain-containing protein [Levilactobacillus enshiensis]|uniref:DUF3383 domain-containing protein n=1 Tax=Levilactobacillus enshiensis TaxID=2590213 RepID=UPI00117A136D|nr:DUF3383 domain-containing protein [Levilactobacillus enshiensis]